MRILDTRVGEVEVLQFSPDGSFLAAGGTHRFLVVLATGTAEASRRSLHARVSCLQFHPRRPLLYAVIGVEAVALTNPLQARELPHFIQPRCDRIALSDDGNSLVASGRFDQTLTGCRVAVFDTTGKEPVTQRWTNPRDGEGTLHWGLAWLSGTNLFALAEWVGQHPTFTARITLRDGTSGEIVKTCPRPGLPNDLLASSTAGCLVAASKATLSVWPRADLDLDPHVIRNESRKHFTGVAFHPSGRYLAATSNDTTVKLYDTESWQVAKTFTWNVGRLRSIAFSPDGTLAAVGSDTGKVVVWDVDL